MKEGLVLRILPCFWASNLLRWKKNSSIIRYRFNGRLDVCHILTLQYMYKQSHSFSFQKLLFGSKNVCTRNLPSLHLRGPHCTAQPPNIPRGVSELGGEMTGRGAQDWGLDSSQLKSTLTSTGRVWDVGWSNHKEGIWSLSIIAFASIFGDVSSQSQEVHDPMNTKRKVGPWSAYISSWIWDHEWEDHKPEAQEPIMFLLLRA